MKLGREKDDFQRDGFVVIRQLLPESEFQLLAENIERYIRDVVPTLDATDAFYQDRRQPETLKQLQNMEQDEFFESYRDHRKWIEVAETLLEEPVIALGPEWFNKPPGTDHPTPAHQDNYYFNLSVLLAKQTLEQLKNPPYRGSVQLGSPLKAHGWHPMNNASLLKIMAGHITSRAPAGTDTEQWKY